MVCLFFLINYKIVYASNCFWEAGHERQCKLADVARRITSTWLMSTNQSTVYLYSFIWKCLIGCLYRPACSLSQFVCKLSRQKTGHHSGWTSIVVDPVAEYSSLCTIALRKTTWFSPNDCHATHWTKAYLLLRVSSLLCHSSLMEVGNDGRSSLTHYSRGGPSGWPVC